MEKMDQVAAMARDIKSADHIIRVLLAKLGGVVEISMDDAKAAMGPGEVVSSQDTVKGTFSLTLVTPQGGAQ